MRIEHVAFNVAQPAEQAQWWAAQLGMRIVFRGEPPVQGRFLTDRLGQVMVELYHNDRAPVPDYAAMDPLVLHLAFSVEDVDAEVERLLAAGAMTAVEAFVSELGDRVAVVRDPWGLPIQLLRRARPML